MKALLRVAILSLLVASGYAAITSGTQVGAAGPKPDQPGCPALTGK